MVRGAQCAGVYLVKHRATLTFADERGDDGKRHGWLAVGDRSFLVSAWTMVDSTCVTFDLAANPDRWLEDFFATVAKS